jgi:hypothetical protein
MAKGKSNNGGGSKGKRRPRGKNGKFVKKS